MVAKIIRNITRLVFPTVQSKRVQPWFRINGDKTLRLFYDDLNSSSVVFDLGGYEGQWASDIYGINNCAVYVFEPFKVYANAIKARFKKNENVRVFPFGLGDSNKTEYLSILDDSSSSFKKSDKANTVEIEIREIISFLKSEKIEKIDLLKINIEGAEYDLLDYIIATGLISKIRNIQVQFHDFVPDAEKRMRVIQNNLRKTHAPTYQYEFVWENWKIL